MLEKDNTKYLFLVNDKRTYDDRLGQYKAILENGVAQKVNISLNAPSDNLYIYDIIEHKELSYSKKRQQMEFDVNLPTAGGKIIALLSQKPERIEIVTPQILKRTVRHKLDIMIKDKNGHVVSGVQPIKVKMMLVVSGGLKLQI
jgi:hypothetical protein